MPSPTVAVISSDATCEQVSDVGTLILNLRIAYDHSRLSPEEWVGVQQLAARMLDRVRAEPGTELSEALEALQGTISRPVDSLIIVHVESEEWNVAFQEFDGACQDAGFPFGVFGWSGG